jgi:hypothetical protein
MPRSGNFGNSSSSSSRIELSSSIKDRFQDRTSSDYRSLPSRDDRDARNGATKRGYISEQTTESRFSDRSAVISAPWTGSSHQSFNISNSHSSNEIWPQKQADNQASSSWRGNVEDRYGSDRFSSNDRKPVIQGSQFLNSSSSHTTMRGGNQSFLTENTIIPSSSSGRFANRYENSRY